MKALLIPIKDPANAKTRLAQMLSPDERRLLAWAMFEDVSRAAAIATKPDRVVIATSYRPAIEHAEQLGWDVLVEQSQQSESASVDWASRLLAERGFDLVMRLPADLPLVQAEDIDELLSKELRAPSALIVPSREGTGTNAIIRTPPALFPSRFGPNSLALHKEAAARAGIECVIVHNPRIALDIDEPADLKLLIESGRGTQAFVALARMNIEKRLKG
ncbi:MAG TPA: 2-phospho-L-lactate guanylyltransferase [Blastocatellia bacterium]|nr:2-phospho-L-lactate guanylyltransferase [Blastocatellia bacterium]